MELVFLLISIISTVVCIYLLGRTIYSHKRLIRAYKRDSFLWVTQSIFGIFMVMILFISLCAMNNTFWHLPYLTN